MCGKYWNVKTHDARRIRIGHHSHQNNVQLRLFKKGSQKFVESFVFTALEFQNIVVHENTTHLLNGKRIVKTTTTILPCHDMAIICLPTNWRKITRLQ
jgi:hypothetical protein